MSKCERSGKGDGGFFDGSKNCMENLHESPAFGSTHNHPQLALDQCKNFMERKCTYLLYLWETLECHDLLRSSMQHLNNDVSAANGSFGMPSVIGHQLSVDDDLSLNSSKGSSKKNKMSKIGIFSSSIQKHTESLKVVRIAAMQAHEDTIMARIALL